MSSNFCLPGRSTIILYMSEWTASFASDISLTASRRRLKLKLTRFLCKWNQMRNAAAFTFSGLHDPLPHHPTPRKGRLKCEEMQYSMKGKPRIRGEFHVCKVSGWLTGPLIDWFIGLAADGSLYLRQQQKLDNDDKLRQSYAEYIYILLFTHVPAHTLPTNAFPKLCVSGTLLWGSKIRNSALFSLQ